MAAHRVRSGRVIDEPQGRGRSHVRGSAGARMIGGEKEHVKDAQRLERCHELAVHPHESSRRTDGNSVHARTNYQELASTATDIDRRASGPYSQKSTVTLSLLSEETPSRGCSGEVRDEPRKQKKVRVRRIDRYDRGEGREVSTANRSWIGSRRVRGLDMNSLATTMRATGVGETSHNPGATGTEPSCPN